MRLLVISREYEPMIAGVSKYISEIMRRLNAEKTVLALKFGNAQRNDVEEISYPALVGRRSIKAVYFVVASVMKALRKDFDVIVGNAFIGSVSGAVVKLLTGKPLVSIIYDVDFLERDAAEYGSINKHVRRHALGAMLWFSDRIIVDSGKVKRDIIRFYGIDTRKIFSIPCGISPASGFGKIGKPKRKIILFVGNMAEKKGLTDLANAMKRVVEKYPRVELWLVGPDRDLFAPYRERLAKLVSELGLKNHIKFLGVVRFVEPYYKACDFLVLPSLHSEGFGLPIAEAAYFGKPAVATEIFRETGVITSKTGLLVPPGNVEMLGNAILKMLKDEKLTRRLGANARKYSKRFDWSKAAKDFENVIRDVL